MQGVMLGGGSSGGGGGSGYADEGIVLRDINLLALSQKSEDYRPSITLTNCTIEICYSATALLGSGGIGRLLSFAGEIFVLNSDLKGTNADYGLQVFYGNEYSATCLAYIDGLTLGSDRHTYTVTQSGTRTNVYFDGVLVGGYDNIGGRTTISGQSTLMLADMSYPVIGTWYDMRVYNRALSAAEIAANHAEDMRRYGGAA